MECANKQCGNTEEAGILILPKGVKEVFQLMLLSLKSECRYTVDTIPESQSVYHPPNAEERRVGVGILSF